MGSALNYLLVGGVVTIVTITIGFGVLFILHSEEETTTTSTMQSSVTSTTTTSTTMVAGDDDNTPDRTTNADESTVPAKTAGQQNQETLSANQASQTKEDLPPTIPNEEGTTTSEEKDDPTTTTKSMDTTLSIPEWCEPCVFPFTYNGVTYDDCAYDSFYVSYPWCATQTHEGIYVDGYYQYCEDFSCFNRDESEVTVTTTTKSMETTLSIPEWCQPCVFPFTYNGVTYDDCAYDASSGWDPWCSTKTHEGEYIDSYFQYCEEYSCFDNDQAQMIATTEVDTALAIPEWCQPCVFPFIYEGVTYDDCADDDGNPWCATATDQGNNYIGEYIWCEKFTCFS